jgi:signal peptidase II
MEKRTIILLILLLLAIDHTIKIYVKTNFYYGEEYYVFGQDWFRLHFWKTPGWPGDSSLAMVIWPKLF